MSDPLPPDAPAGPAADAATDPAPPASDPSPSSPAPTPEPSASSVPAATPEPAASSVPAAQAPGAGGSPAPARPYTAPDTDAPQYELPAYAVPVGYTVPAYAEPSAAPVAGDGTAPMTGYSLPPYARPAAPPPGGPFGYPGGPAYPAPPAYAMTPAGPPPRGGADRRPKTVAIIALVLAVGGTLLALMSAVGGGSDFGLLATLLLLPAFVLGLIAVVSEGQGGTGLGIGALVLSVVGGVVTIVIVIASAFGTLSSSGGEGDDYDDYSDYSDYSGGVPSLAAPGTDGLPDAGAQFAEPVAPTVTETAFGRESDGAWWYAVVIDNPNTDYVFDTSFLDVTASDSAGTEIESSPEVATLLSGSTVIVGTFFFDAGDTAEIASIEVRLPEASEATLSPAAETGTFATAELVTTTDYGSTTVTGTVSALFADEQDYVVVSVLARDSSGTIVAASQGYVDDRVGATPVPFEAWFYDEVPADVSVEALAHR